MKQLLGTSQGVAMARMPRPAVEPGCILVKTAFSLVSAGTELASLRPSDEDPNLSKIERIEEISDRARHYFRASLHDPRKAAQRLMAIAKNQINTFVPESTVALAKSKQVGSLQWRSESGAEFDAIGDNRVRVKSNGAASAYQLVSEDVDALDYGVVEVSFVGQLKQGNIGFGVLDVERQIWIGQFEVLEGSVGERLIVDLPDTTRRFALIFYNDGEGRHVELEMTSPQLLLKSKPLDGMPANDMTAQGWGLGYSASGVVVGVGDGVDGFAIGDRVACGGAGQANHAEYIVVRQNLAVKIPDNVSLEVGAMTTVGSIAMQGVRRASPQIGEVFLVQGLGLIGMLTCQILKAAGAHVIGFDLDPSRVEKAINFGAVNATTDEAELREFIDRATAGHGVDAAVITASGKSNAIINLAMKSTRRKGRVVIVGDVGLTPERADFYKKEIDLLMSSSYGPGRYDPLYENEGADYPYAYVRWTMNRNMASFLDLAHRELTDPQRAIERVADFDEAPQAYKDMLDQSTSPPLGLLLRYAESNNDDNLEAISLRGARALPQSGVNYALVGVGAFGTSMIVPALEKCSGAFNLAAVVSRDAVRGGNYARSMRVEKLASSIDAVLTDENLDMVAITTRHHEHADAVVKALKAGKIVYVEKPLAVTWEQLDAVKAATEMVEAPRLMIGFNRRFAPAMETLADKLSNRKAPLVMSYRMNAGYIDPAHWIQTAEGGGRNIGEACHIYDVFRFLAGAPVVEINASGATDAAGKYLSNDNFVATLKYDDGSVATLQYTAMGPKTVGKERLEVFSNGELLCLDDYSRLSALYENKILWDGKVDKGHATQMQRFADALREAVDLPIRLEDIFEVSATALQVEDMLRGQI